MIAGSSRMPAAWRSRRASFRFPEAIGFITPTLTFIDFNSLAIPHATSVFPTPVSVPVIKRPLFIRLFAGCHRFQQHVEVGVRMLGGHGESDPALAGVDGGRADRRGEDS